MQEIPSALTTCVLLPPPSRLSPRHRHPNALARAPSCPTTLTPKPPRQPPSPHDPPELAPRSAVLRISQQSCCRLPTSPSSVPGYRVRSRRKPSSPGTVRSPPRQHRRLPVTPQPQASYRHRLPQQPANCSVTTSLLIEWAHGLNNSRSRWLCYDFGPPLGAPPKDPVWEQGKHGFILLLLNTFYLSQTPAAKCRKQSLLPGSVMPSLRCLGALHQYRNVYHLPHFPAVRN